jgi:hypothetical protein
LKFTGGQRLLPWIVRHCDNPGVVLLRHPLALVASIRAMEAWSPATSNEPVTLDFDAATLAAFPELEKCAGVQVSRLEHAAYWVCVDLLFPLRDHLCRERLAFAPYEALSADPRLFERIVSLLGLHMISTDADIHGRPSATTLADSNVRRGGDPRTSWRHRLTDAERATILRVMNELGLDFYGADGGLRLAALRSRQIQHLVLDFQAGR